MELRGLAGRQGPVQDHRMAVYRSRLKACECGWQGTVRILATVRCRVA